MGIVVSSGGLVNTTRECYRGIGGWRGRVFCDFNIINNFN